MGNFGDNITIFLINITCFYRIQGMLKLYEDAYSSKITFSKAKHFGLEYINIEMIDQNKWNAHNFPLEYLKLIW